MIRALLETIASYLPPPRVIYDRSGTSPYLSRYYLLGGPFMADGSAPFDGMGDPKPGIREPERPLAVFLHRFHRGDEDPELHNHPWVWSLSLILAGGYKEERRDGLPPDGKPGAVAVRVHRAPGVNVIGHTTFHRVDLLDGEAWSLFIAGPRAQDWGFWNARTGIFTQWREFIEKRRQGKVATEPAGWGIYRLDEERFLNAWYNEPLTEERAKWIAENLRWNFQVEARPLPREAT